MSLIDANLKQVIDYITERDGASFGEIHDFMSQHNIYFGAARNPIEVLDVEAYRTGLIDVDYSDQQVYTRPRRLGPM